MAEVKLSDGLDDDTGSGEGMCDCGKTLWLDCDCGAFFEDWVCGMDYTSGQCSLAGSEDCDFECPVMARRRSARTLRAALREAKP